MDFFFESAMITIVKKDYRDLYLPVDDDVDYLVDGPGGEGVVSAQLFSSVIRNNSQSKVRSVRVQLRVVKCEKLMSLPRLKAVPQSVRRRRRNVKD